MSTNHNFIKIITSILLVFCFQHAISSPIKYVYRFDTRFPSIIFSQGFKAYGVNNNILEHVQGISIQERTSRFVSTSRDRQAALTYARELYMYEPSMSSSQQGGYLYRIRATQDFYPIDLTLRAFIQRNDSSSAWARQLLVMYDYQQEMAAEYGIESTTVMEAVPVTFNANTQEIVTHENQAITNSHYVDEDTSANSSGYPLPPTFTEQCKILLSAVKNILVPAGYRNNCSGPSSSSSSTNQVYQSDQCELFEYNINQLIYGSKLVPLTTFLLN